MKVDFPVIQDRSMWLELACLANGNFHGDTRFLCVQAKMKTEDKWDVWMKTESYEQEQKSGID